MSATTEARQVGEILSIAAEYLATKQIQNAPLAAKLLMSRLLGCKPLELPMRLNDTLSDARLEAMRRGVKRVAGGEPLQYVLGEWEFMGHRFKVDRRALIPRPETEGLVERALACDTVWQADAPLVVDIGTGSGVIAISLALAKPSARVIALDAHEEPLTLARENAAAHGVLDRVVFARAELPDVVEPECVDLIAANLPYIPTRQFEALPPSIREHEPRSALDGGPRGLSVMTPIVQDAALALAPHGLLYLEIGEDQADAVTHLLHEAGFADVRIEPDLADRPRYARARLQAIQPPPMEIPFPAQDE